MLPDGQHCTALPLSGMHTSPTLHSPLHTPHKFVAPGGTHVVGLLMHATAHADMHTPFTQLCPPGQVRPHAPQFDVLCSMHAPIHSSLGPFAPGPHTQLPL